MSYSEITRAMTCQAAHAFSYTGYLTGGTVLKRRELAPILSDGRAWGAAVAAFHASSDELFPSLAASSALADSYASDLAEMTQAGFSLVPSDQLDRRIRLEKILEHYMTTTVPLTNLTRIEGEINVPIPARTGTRGSSRYRFMCRIDGYTIDIGGQQWIVEFKLRNSLQRVEQIMLSRQPRWYAWALSRAQSDFTPVGVLVDERLNQPPLPPRLVQGKRKQDDRRPSHARDQFCTPEDYLAVCQEHDVAPRPETLDSLRARRWQQRVPILFRPGELEEAGRELVSAAQLVRDLDSGSLFPIRNAQPSNCNSCTYKPICAEPSDQLFVDTLFVRDQPKRERSVPRDHAKETSS